MQDILGSAKASGPAASALGPTYIKPQNVALTDLPREISGLHLGMPQPLLKADMRLIPIAVLLTWASLKVYEEVHAATECLQMPYEAVTDDMWATTCVLSWRWGEPKPPLHIPQFSPMTGRQWAELMTQMACASQLGMVHVWIDWSCVPQYSDTGATMTEVLRSKVYYARAGAMVVVPTFTPLPASGPITLLLNHVVALLQKRAGSAVDGGTREAIAALVLHAVLAKTSFASKEYFERAWTLAERIARYGRNECLCQWMSLETWLGMVLDGLIKGKFRDTMHECLICFYV